MIARAVSVLEKVGGVFLLGVALLTFVMVILRKFFDTSIPDWFDLSRLLQGIALFWGIAAACYRGGHILVDLVWDFSSPKNKRRIDLVAHVLLIMFMAALALFATIAAFELRGKNLLTSDLRLPQWGFYMMAALGIIAAVLMTWMRMLAVEAEHRAGAHDAPPPRDLLDAMREQTRR